MGDYDRRRFKMLKVCSFVISGVMSRRGRRRVRELARESEARRHERDKPDSPLLQNDNHQRASTSYASVNPLM